MFLAEIFFSLMMMLKLAEHFLSKHAYFSVWKDLSRLFRKYISDSATTQQCHNISWPLCNISILSNICNDVRGPWRSRWCWAQEICLILFWAVLSWEKNLFDKWDTQSYFYVVLALNQTKTGQFPHFYS